MFDSSQFFSGGTTGFYPKTIGQSLRFNDDDNAFMTRTFVSPTSNKLFTWSSWIKRANLSTTQVLFGTGNVGSGSSFGGIYFDTSDRLVFFEAQGAGTYKVTTRQFRDPSAWYHIVVNKDAANTTAKIYVNGVQETDFSTDTDPSNVDTSNFNSALDHTIGHNQSGTSHAFDGYLAEVYFIDGTALTPSAFAETKNGIWIPKETSISSFGNNGFHLTFSNSSNIGADSSGEGHNFTPDSSIAATDVVSDSPTKNYAVMNALDGGGTLSDGNLYVATDTGATRRSNFGMSTGKWYFEFVVNSTNWSIGLTTGTDSSERLSSGTKNTVLFSFGRGSSTNTGGIEDSSQSTKSYDNHTPNVSSGTYGFALDLDAANPKCDVYYNGTLAYTFDTFTVDPPYFFGVDRWNGSPTTAHRVNFGQEDFVQSVPAGYKEVNTSNLPDPSIDPDEDEESRDYFETFLYTGNGTGLQVGDVIKKPVDTITINKSAIWSYTGSTSTSARLERTFGTPTSQSKYGLSFWVKKAYPSGAGAFQKLFAQKGNGTNDLRLGFNSSDQLTFAESDGAWGKTTTRSFERTDVWYHILLNFDQAEAAADRVKIYVDGVLQALTGTNAGGGTYNLNKASTAHFLGCGQSASSSTRDSFFGGYMAEIHFSDGYVYDPTTYGSFDANGVWVPKTVSISNYGNNGFYLDFADSSDLGDDESGNTNNWTPVNIASGDQVVDTPTNNHMNLNSNYQRGSNNTFSEGNLQTFIGTPSNSSIVSHRLPRTGKHYFEFELDTETGNAVTVGFVDATIASGSLTHYAGTGHFGYYASNGSMYVNSSTESYGAIYTEGDFIGVAIDFDAKTVQFYKNNTGQGVFDYGSRFPNVQDWRILASNATNTAPGHTLIFDFGQKGFTYTPPTGYTALSENNITVDADNLEAPDFVWIKNRDATDSHQLYDSMRGVQKVISTDPDTNPPEADAPNGLLQFNKNGFTIGPQNEVNTSGENYVAWCWKSSGTAQSATYAVKVVSDSGNKYRFDDFGSSAVTLELSEGGTYTFDQSDSSNSSHPLRFSTTSDGTHGGGSEYTTGVTTSGTPGTAGAFTRITVATGAPTLYYYCTQHSGMGGQANTPSTKGYSNFKGTIQSKVLVNTEVGFSIARWTGNATTNATAGHGLDVKPRVVIIKATNDSTSWQVNLATEVDGTARYMRLNLEDEAYTLAGFLTTIGAQTLTFTGTNNSQRQYNNRSGKEYIAYCFTDVDGYSKFATYEGNGSSNGPFVFTGFKPAWVMIRRANTSAGNDWIMHDGKRNPFNTTNLTIQANENTAEQNFSINIDLVSNGFKINSAGNPENNSSGTYFYMAFAEQPFKYSNAR